MDERVSQQHLQQLRDNRNFRDRDFSLSFLQRQFKNEIEKPFKQIAGLVEVWNRLVPEHIATHTRLESLSRGILRVSVESNSWLYELDKALRSGLQNQIISEFRGKAFRRVQLKVDPAPFFHEE
ncbi:hypothetical protein KS4_17690 [Poriferisphaera corsica]|uniref:DUF721 domain-containing protein n=1 Tax=Poriferisphaera corsica TaxID=2528020 RepID=A0A517YU06_9BACT|nr:DciA family protein [Poriferisphaera corsica]QDU33713.1 hypothetical protein KS4_17690 [Poriferisphaera corsica]